MFTLGEEHWVIILVALIGASAGVFTFLQGRRQSKIMLRRDIVREWEDLYTSVQAENRRLEAEVARVRNLVEELQRKVVELETRYECELGGWGKERDDLKEKIANLKQEIADLTRVMKTQNGNRED